MTTSNVILDHELISHKSIEKNENDERLLKTYFPKGITYLGLFINCIFRISSNWAARLTMFMFSINIPKKLKEKDRSFYDRGVKQNFKQGKYRFNVYEYGNGPKVLLVHGWTCGGLRWASYVDKVVNAGYTALVMDAPAHGTSPGYSLPVPEYVLCVKEVINSYSGVHAIVSHSMGSIVSTIGLSKSDFNQNDTKLVLMNSFADCDSLISRFAKCIGVDDRVMQHTRKWIEEYTYAPLDYFSLVGHLSNIEAKVLLISDSKDIVVPQREVGKILSSEYPIEFVQTKGLGHRLKSAEIENRVIDHISSNSRLQLSIAN